MSDPSVFHLPDLLPAAAIVAILIFLLREALEQVRRRGERRRKRAAVKELLQHEVAENYRVLVHLFHAIDSSGDTVDGTTRDTILVQHGGRLRYERVDEAGSVIVGCQLPEPKLTEFNRLLQSAAELDKRLYAEIRAGYDQVFEIEHLHHSFVNFLTGRAEEREMWLDGFRQYAYSLYDDIDRGLRKLHIVLAGRELQQRGFRRPPEPLSVDGGVDSAAKATPTGVAGRPLSEDVSGAESVRSVDTSVRRVLDDDYYVVDFQHIDDFRCVSPLGDEVRNGMFTPSSPQERQEAERELRAELADLFTKAGWEGDGEINCIFIAPCFTSSGSNWCETVYHVKQSNNGTSWLAIPKKLHLQLPKGFFAKHELDLKR